MSGQTRRGRRSDATEQPRRIFVGDVQGCADELDALLVRARARFGDACEAWFVGDLVNRGPASLRVLECVRALEAQGRARVVLGNHELALLQCWFGLRAPGPRDTTAEILAAPDASDWIDWLRTRPVALVDAIGAEPFAMVHASVHPDWSLEDLAHRARRIEARLGHDDPDECRRLLEAMVASDAPEDRDAEALGRIARCRSVTRGGKDWSSSAPDERAGSVAWHSEWAKRGHAYGIVYGHWALQRLHVAPGLRGLDTGCVHHGRGHDGFLTAWLGAADGRSGKGGAFSLPDDRFLAQKALRMYYDFE